MHLLVISAHHVRDFKIGFAYPPSEFANVYGRCNSVCSWQCTRTRKYDENSEPETRIQCDLGDEKVDDHQKDTYAGKMDIANIPGSGKDFQHLCKCDPTMSAGFRNLHEAPQESICLGCSKLVLQILMTISI